MTANQSPTACASENPNAESIALTGDSEISGVAALQSELLNTTTGDRQVVIECADATSIDVATMQLLLSAMLQPGSQCRIDLGPPDSAIADALSLAGLSEHFIAAQTAPTHSATAPTVTNTDVQELNAPEHKSQQPL